MYAVTKCGKDHGGRGEGQACHTSPSGQGGPQGGRAETRFPLMKVPQVTGQREVGVQEGRPAS